MTTAPDHSCDDDLVLARASSRRLSARTLEGRSFTRSEPDALRESAAGFVSLARRLREAPLSAAGSLADEPEGPSLESVPEPAIDLLAIESTGAGPWQDLLSWSRAVTSAHAAFIADRDGLLVISEGDLDLAGGFDALAPHVVVAFKHLNPTNAQEVPWGLTVLTGTHRLVAVRFDSRLTGEIVIGLLIDGQVTTAMLEGIRARADMLFQLGE
jgi:hypothetical protein